MKKLFILFVLFILVACEMPTEPSKGREQSRANRTPIILSGASKRLVIKIEHFINIDFGGYNKFWLMGLLKNAWWKLKIHQTSFWRFIIKIKLLCFLKNRLRFDNLPK